jgi:hypothetical protein
MMTTPARWSRALLLVGRVLLLIATTFVAFSLSAVISGLAKAPVPGPPTPASDVMSPPSEAGTAATPAPEVGQEAAAPQPGPGVALALLGVCVLIAVAVTPVVVQSRWSGWRLAVALALLIYGEMTVLSQIETIVYLRQASREFVTTLFAFGALFAALLAPAAVLILGRMSDGAVAGRAAPRPIGWPGWIWRIAVVAVLHVATYYTAGYYLAWKNPAVRAYYGGTDPGSFLLQLKSIAVGTPWMYPYQFAQGILWALLVVLLVRMLAGSRLAVAVVAAVFLGIVGPCQLLLPNPMMPTDVRLTHLFEIVASRVVFTLVAVWLLRPADASPLSAGPA